MKDNKARFLLKSDVANRQDEDDAIAENNINNYKGVFYGGDTEQRYYEGGAHFQYKDLVRRLEKVYAGLTVDRRGTSLYHDVPERSDRSELNSRNMKQQLIPHNTQNMNRTRNNFQVNNNQNNATTLFLNNIVYNQLHQVENGGENASTRLTQQLTMNLHNKKSRNNANSESALNKPDNFIAKTNIYVKKSIDEREKVENKQQAKDLLMKTQITQKPIVNNNNHTRKKDMSLKEKINTNNNKTTNSTYTLLKG